MSSNTSNPIKSCKRQSTFPVWLRKRLPAQSTKRTAQIIKEYHVHTVCDSARCPNRSECYANDCATFLIMGPACTRSCTFCAVEKRKPEALDPNEPARVAQAASELGLKYVVITSVTRDDIPDGGAGHFRKTVEELRKVIPDAVIEILTPDFRGDRNALDQVCRSDISVFNHNVETVPRLYSEIRPQAEYRRSLEVLRYVHSMYPHLSVKSGLMVGIGETIDEVKDVLKDLKNNGSQIVTIGQYLQPARESMHVDRYVMHEEYKELIQYGRSIGLENIYAGPFIRSSYNAKDVFKKMKKNSNE